MEAMRNNLHVIDENRKELSSIYSPNVLSPVKAYASKIAAAGLPNSEAESFNLSPSIMSE